MLTSGQKAALDAIKVSVNRIYHYERTHDGHDDANLTLDLENGTVAIHGEVQTVDELEYAVARLITAYRKEVGHGRVAETQPART